MRNHEKSLAVVRFAFLVGFCSFISRMKTPQKREHGLSNAYKAFQKNMEDIERLLELHTQEGGSEPGRRYGLEVLNKSAIVLIFVLGGLLRRSCLRRLGHLCQAGQDVRRVGTALTEADCGRAPESRRSTAE